MKQIKLLAAVMLLAAAAHAQTDTTHTKPLFKLSANFNSGLNYYGRTDSLKSTGFFPVAELWFSKNFYISGAPIFVNNKQQHFTYAGSVATAGFQHVSTKWITSAYITKPFYKQSSELVQSALKLQSGLGLSFLNKLVNLNAGGDIKYSDKADYGANAGIDHLVKIQYKNGSVLAIDPSVYVYAGTQNFQNSYYKKTNSSFLLFPGNSQLVTEDVSKFAVLSYEASIPVVYAIKKWMFIASPAYVLPQNLVTVPNRPDLSERGENMFYATLTTKYTF